MEKLKNILIGTAIVYGLTIILLLGFSILLTSTNISEGSITITIVIISAISLFLGSFIANIKENKNGIVNGALVGIIYAISLYIISSALSNNYLININTIITVIIGIIIGSVAGILGVNIKVKNNKK